MKELINLTKQAINDDVVETVNARELHDFLQSKQDFSTWIKNRIEKYGFVENQDFIKLHKKMEREVGATTRIEYHITLDMAKQLAMVENNDMGMQARRYFIDCEKTLKHSNPLLPQTKLEALKAYVAEIEAHEQTKQHLTHEKECAKLENGKSIYGASLKQVNNKLNTNYHWRPLQQWCDDNGTYPETIYPNGYDSICVRVYPTQAWDDVYQVDLNQLF